MMYDGYKKRPFLIKQPANSRKPLPKLLHGLVRVIFLPQTFFDTPQRYASEDVNLVRERKQPVPVIRAKYDPVQSNLTNEELENRILDLYEKVWLGLYQANAPNGPFRYDEIRALYHGAGLGESSERESEIRPLNRLYFRTNNFQDFVVPTGINDMKLYPCQSSEIRFLMVSHLTAYESEIPQIEEVYRLLQEAQVGLGERAHNEHALKQRYLDIVKPLEDRLALYDNRMAWLKKEVHDESIHIVMNCRQAVQGCFLHQKVFNIIN